MREFGWKHDSIDEDWISENPEYESFYVHCQIKTIICIKNPYHWLYSIRDYCNKVPEYGKYKPERLLKRYSDMYLHWHKELMEKEHRFFHPVFIFRYEDLLSDLGKELDQLGLEYKEPNILINPKIVRLSDYFSEERKQYYLNPLQMEEKEMINRVIPDELFNKYGYERQ